MSTFQQTRSLAYFAESQQKSLIALNYPVQEGSWIMALRFLAWYRHNFPDSGFIISLTWRQEPLQDGFPRDADIPGKLVCHYKGLLYEESDLQLSRCSGVRTRVCTRPHACGWCGRKGREGDSSMYLEEGLRQGICNQKPSQLQM